MGTLMKIRIIDGDNIIDRDMTEQELQDHKKIVDDFNASEQKRLETLAARQAVLDKLGLTANEAAALFGQ